MLEKHDGLSHCTNLTASPFPPDLHWFGIHGLNPETLSYVEAMNVDRVHLTGIGQPVDDAVDWVARGIWLVPNPSLSTADSHKAPANYLDFVCMFEENTFSTTI